jgi:queuine tRNA-ribosyltransferase
MSFALRARDGRARRGSLSLAHGVVETPAFMPVGTAATVKALTPAEVRELGAQILLANTYHLWLRPGRDTLVAAGGLHAFMGWSGPILTDSGGFQVFSLESRRALDDDGVRFRSHLDGSEHQFTPENVVAFQEALGVDVAMALDVCVKLPADPAEVADAVRRTSLWAARCAAARTRTETALFGIVQGGLDERERARSAADLVALGLPGYAIGGLSVGESRSDMERVARFTAELLPADRPRYLMGVGTVRDLLIAVDAGIDLFDCVYPTRCGGAATIRSATRATRAIGGRSRKAAAAACARPSRVRISRICSAATRCSDRGCSRTTICTCWSICSTRRARRSQPAAGPRFAMPPSWRGARPRRIRQPQA